MAIKKCENHKEVRIPIRVVKSFRGPTRKSLRMEKAIARRSKRGKVSFDQRQKEFDEKKIKITRTQARKEFWPKKKK